MIIKQQNIYKKEVFIWLFYRNKIARIANGFRQKLRSYFSNMYKDIIKNDMKLDFNKWFEELVKLYAEEVTKGLSLGFDRARKEMTAFELSMLNSRKIENDFTYFITEQGYIICMSIMKTTERILNEIVNDPKIEDKRQRVNEIFESWKTNRSKTIAKTEIYRAFNFSYIITMENAGYLYKKWFTPPSETNCEACNKLADRVVGIKNSFAETDERDRLWNGLYPPVHPNDDCILFALNIRKLN